MPLFGSKKDKDHKDDVSLTDTHHHHSSTHGHHTTDALDSSGNPSKEFKYERVEKIAVDKDGHAELKDVREDRGAEDPGMNYKDKRPPGLVRGHPEGYVPDVNEMDTMNTHSSSAYSTSGTQRSHNTDAYSSSEPGLATETVLVREAYASNSPSTGSRHRDVDSVHGRTSDYSSSGLRRSDEDNVSLTSTASAASRTTGSQQMTQAVRREVPNLTNDVNILETEVERLRESGLGEPQLNPEGGTYRQDYNRSTGGLTGQTGYGTSGSTVHRHVIHDTTEVIRETSAQRAPQVDIITVPVQRMEGSRLEHVRSGYTYTDSKEVPIPGPMMAPPIHSATKELLVQGSGGATAEIHAATNVDLLSAANVESMAPEEYERYRQRVEELARQHEAEANQKAAQYRTQVEQDAELIRRTLERQHIRDIEFRKDMVESAVDRQQHEIQLEAEYAMRALEKEREAARQALEAAKMQTNIDVRVDTAVGTTVSRGSVSTASEHTMQETTGRLGTRL